MKRLLATATLLLALTACGGGTAPAPLATRVVAPTSTVAPTATALPATPTIDPTRAALATADARAVGQMTATAAAKPPPSAAKLTPSSAQQAKSLLLANIGHYQELMDAGKEAFAGPGSSFATWRQSSRAEFDASYLDVERQLVIIYGDGHVPEATRQWVAAISEAASALYTWVHTAEDVLIGTKSSRDLVSIERKFQADLSAARKAVDAVLSERTSPAVPSPRLQPTTQPQPVSGLTGFGATAQDWNRVHSVLPGTDLADANVGPRAGAIGHPAAPFLSAGRVFTFSYEFPKPGVPRATAMREVMAEMPSDSKSIADKTLPGCEFMAFKSALAQRAFGDPNLVVTVVLGSADLAIFDRDHVIEADFLSQDDPEASC